MAAIATEGLAVPIGMHAAWNFASWLIGFKESSGYWRPITSLSFERQAYAIEMTSYVVVVGSATALLWLWHLRKCGRQDDCEA
jgi:hypothetical protein